MSNPNDLISYRCRNRMHYSCRSINCACACHRQSTAEDDSVTFEEAARQFVEMASPAAPPSEIDKASSVLFEAVRVWAQATTEMDDARKRSEPDMMRYAAAAREAEARVSTCVVALRDEIRKGLA